MSKVLFSNPLGGMPERIGLEEVLDLLSKKDETYWNSPADNGCGVLDYYPQERSTEPSATLLITMKNDYRFHLNFQEHARPGETQSFYAIGSDDYGDLVWVNRAGEEAQLARPLFVRRETAVEAVSEFFASGRRSPQVLWTHANDIPWDQFEEYR